MNYVHGGDIYRNNIEYDFSVNINPLGMPKSCVEAAVYGIGKSAEYPDCECDELRTAIEKNRGIKKEYIAVGNGAAELIYAVCMGLKVKNALAAAPCFQEYERAVIGAGGSMTYYNLKEENNFYIDEEFLNLISDNIDIVFLCNPNNPTGNLTDREFIKKIADKCSKTNTILCIDECFMPFVKDKYSMLCEIENYNNIVILRAFTKIFAMAGLRLGYAVTKNYNVLNKMKSVIQPWNVSLPAQRAGIAAAGEKEFVKKSVEYIQNEKKILINELSKNAAIKIYASEANFIFFKGRSDLYERLIEKKILIRDCSNFVNLNKGFFRAAVKSHNENLKLAEVLL